MVVVDFEILEKVLGAVPGVVWTAAAGDLNQGGR
jgi:hypothetical protein